MQIQFVKPDQLEFILIFMYLYYNSLSYFFLLNKFFIVLPVLNLLFRFVTIYVIVPFTLTNPLKDE